MFQSTNQIILLFQLFTILNHRLTTDSPGKFHGSKAPTSDLSCNFAWPFSEIISVVARLHLPNFNAPRRPRKPSQVLLGDSSRNLRLINFLPKTCRRPKGHVVRTLGFNQNVLSTYIYYNIYMYCIYIYICIYICIFINITIWEKKTCHKLETHRCMDDMSMFENFGDCPLIWGWGWHAALKPVQSTIEKLDQFSCKRRWDELEDTPIEYISNLPLAAASDLSDSCSYQIVYLVLSLEKGICLKAYISAGHLH